MFFKIKKSNTKISAHYQIMCLYSENIWFNVFIADKCFNFFWNKFYTKRIKISNIIIIIIVCYSHAKQPNEFQYQSTHQDLLYMPHPLFLVD